MTSTPDTDPSRRRALTVLGVVAAVLVLALVALFLVSTTGLVPATTRQSEPVTADAVFLDLRAPGHVEIIASGGDEATIETRVRDPLGLATEGHRLQGDTLVIESRCSNLWINFFNPCRVDYVVRVPASTEVGGSTHNSGVNVVGLDATIDLTNRNGTMTVENVDGLVRLETHNGAIEVSGVNGDLVLFTRNGRVTVSDSVAPGIVEATTRNGRVEVSNTTGRLNVRSNNGPIDLTDVVSDRISAQTSNGRVNMRLSTAPDEVVASSNNGSIEIVLPADAPAYAVEARTRNGRVDTAGIDTDSTSSFTIEATTDNGSITISRAR